MDDATLAVAGDGRSTLIGSQFRLHAVEEHCDRFLAARVHHDAESRSVSRTANPLFLLTPTTATRVGLAISATPAVAGVGHRRVGENLANGVEGDALAVGLVL